MEAKAILRHAGMSSQKVAPALDLIRGKNVDVAMGILRNSRRRANEYLVKLLASAIANAEVKEMNVDNLYVAECFVCQGPTLKRGQARGRGGYDRLLKRTCHITVVVKERV
jgi:large subunit ribosomal protein L22